MIVSIQELGGVVHIMQALEEPGIRAGLLRCHDWYLSGGDTSFASRSAEALGKRCVLGVETYAPVTCIRCIGMRP